MKVVILEDEALVAKDLQKTLLEIDTSIDIVVILQSLAQAIKWFKNNQTPDLVFLDIQLSDGVSFDLFKSVPLTCPIIFTTAYSEYAIRAFKLNSIDYLLKPIEKAELMQALDKFKKWKIHHIDLQSVLKELTEVEIQKKYKERFLVQFKNALVPLSVREIACFQKNELIFIHTFEGKKFVCDANTMDELEELLNPAEFYRANRQFLIHLDNIHILKTTHKGLTVLLKSPAQQEVEISREKVTQFKNWLAPTP